MRLFGDVSAILLAGEVDGLGGTVCGGAGGGDVRAATDDIEDAPAVRDEPVDGQRRAGVEDVMNLKIK